MPSVAKVCRILSAEKSTIAGNLQLLRFTAEDPQAKHTINAAEANRRVTSLLTGMKSSLNRQEPPRFAKVWGEDRKQAAAEADRSTERSSDRYRDLRTVRHHRSLYR